MWFKWGKKKDDLAPDSAVAGMSNEELDRRIRKIVEEHGNYTRVKSEMKPESVVRVTRRRPIPKEGEE